MISWIDLLKTEKLMHFKNWNRNQYQASYRFTKGCQLLKVNEVPCRT